MEICIIHVYRFIFAAAPKFFNNMEGGAQVASLALYSPFTRPDSANVSIVLRSRQVPSRPGKVVTVDNRPNAPNTSFEVTACISSGTGDVLHSTFPGLIVRTDTARIVVAPNTAVSGAREYRVLEAWVHVHGEPAA